MIRPRALPPLPRAALVLLGAVAFALLAWWLDRRMLGVAPETYFGARAIAANAVPGLLGALILTLVTRRPGFSLLVVAGVQALLYRIGSLKLQVLGDPVGLQDLYFLTNLTPDSFSLLGAYVERPLLLAGATVALGTVAGLAWWIERPAFRAFRATHVGLAIVAVALCVSLGGARQPWRGAYDKDLMRPNRFKAIPGVLHAGLMSNLVYSHIQNARATDTLDEAALGRLLAAVPVRTTPSAKDAARPDIVVILSESLFDPRLMKGMDAVPDTIPNVRAAIDSGHGGAMQVPTFGGGTVRTEFEVLTGMPMAAFPDAPFPYVTLVRDSIPSLVSAVEAHGYRSIAIHGNAGSFWNRNNAYESLGFDRFITKDEFPADARRDGLWLSDEATTDVILSQLEPVSDPAPKLVVALSIEAHGPYQGRGTIDTAERDAIALPAGLPAAQALELRNYLYHAAHADAQFGRLLRALRERGRPTLVLFFGDHLPGLRGVFDTLGFLDGRAGPRQLVPWVLWDSGHPDRTTEAMPRMASWMLPAMLLDRAGIHDDPYFALAGSVARDLQRAKPPEQRMLQRGIEAAAVARINGSLPERIEKAGNVPVPKEARQ